MQSPPRCRLRFLVAPVVAFCCWSSSLACAQGKMPSPGAIDFKKSGTKFEIKISVKGDPASADRADDRGMASVTVKLRISAHASESQFFGEVTQDVDFFDLAAVEGSPEVSVWKEAQCHQRRGLPKVTVVAIDGSIAAAKKQMPIQARPRLLGKRLPADEISQGTQLPVFDRNGAAMGYRSRSKTSRLLVDVRIYAVDCDLMAARRQGSGNG